MNYSLTYEVRLPSNYNTEQQYPVIFALHGMGSDEQDMLRLMEPLQSDFIIVAVRGPIVQGAATPIFKLKALAIPSVNCSTPLFRDCNS